MTGTPQPPGGRVINSSIEINAPIDVVWNAISTGEELARWFPTECEVTPGVGGAVSYKWLGSDFGEARIEVWDPPRRIMTSWPGGPPDPATNQPTRLLDDYQLEARGGSTLLRLTSSGFGRGAQWDGMYDCIRVGWMFELRGLRHYLEPHRGVNRDVVWVRHKTRLPRDQAWQRLLGPEGFGLPSHALALKEGEPYRATPTTGSPFSGTMLNAVPNAQFVGTISELNDALLRLEINAADPPGASELWIWLSAYGVPGAHLERFDRAWHERLKTIMAGGA